MPYILTVFQPKKSGQAFGTCDYSWSIILIMWDATNKVNICFIFAAMQIWLTVSGTGMSVRSSGKVRGG